MSETFEKKEITVGRSYTFYYLLREFSFEDGKRVLGRALGALRGVCKVERVSGQSFMVKIDKDRTTGTGCYKSTLPEVLYLLPKYFLKEV